MALTVISRQPKAGIQTDSWSVLVTSRRVSPLPEVFWIENVIGTLGGLSVISLEKVATPVVKVEVRQVVHGEVFFTPMPQVVNELPKLLR